MRLCWAIITRPIFPRASAASVLSAGALVLTGYRLPNCYRNPPPWRVFCARCLQPVTRGPGVAPDPPSETHRAPGALVRAPWAGVRVAFFMTIWEGFSNWHKACHFLICTLSSVDRGTRGTQSRSASLLALSTSPGPRSAKRGAALASGYKVHVSYKQHSGETISMFHVEQKVVKKG